METSLLNQGAALMLVGMGTVFAFLTILVAAMSAMSALAMKFIPVATNDAVTDEEIAAITTAIARHRKNSE